MVKELVNDGLEVRVAKLERRVESWIDQQDKQLADAVCAVSKRENEIIQTVFGMAQELKDAQLRIAKLEQKNSQMEFVLDSHRHNFKPDAF